MPITLSYRDVEDLLAERGVMVRSARDRRGRKKIGGR
jgi:transposase-like protein